MKTIRSGKLIFLYLFLFSSPQLKASDLVYTSFFNQLAVSGYDTVSYFLEGTPQKGDGRFQVLYQGASWVFVSQKNMDLFKENPEKYAPQYGGYCAWAVSQGYTAKGDPRFWHIFEGKLYLNYSLSVQKRWEKKLEEHITLADRNWPGVLD